MKTVSEAKLMELFTIAYDLGERNAMRCDNRAVEKEYMNAMDILIADCHPSDRLSDEVVRLRDSA